MNLLENQRLRFRPEPLEVRTICLRRRCPGLFVVFRGDEISLVSKQNQHHLPITFDQLEGGSKPVATFDGVGRRFDGSYARKIIVWVYIGAGDTPRGTAIKVAIKAPAATKVRFFQVFLSVSVAIVLSRYLLFYLLVALEGALDLVPDPSLSLLIGCLLSMMRQVSPRFILAQLGPI